MLEITPALSERLVSRLCDAEPELVGVLLAGSWAREEADIYSDVDLVALTRGAPRRDERVFTAPGGASAS
jgi:predicted nucleotidyltransferase